MRAEFGKCPCYRCQNTPLLPTGLSDENNVEPLKLFCPCCKEIYNTQPPYNSIFPLLIAISRWILFWEIVCTLVFLDLQNPSRFATQI